MKHITVQALNQLLKTEADNPKVAFINVCTPTEFKQKHIKGIKNFPLDELEHRLNELKSKQTIYIHCQSGNRSRQAIEKLTKLGINSTLVNVEGGLTAWEQSGFKTHSTSNSIPIIRQVFIAAGLLNTIFAILALTLNPTFTYLSLFIGLGLTFAGITGWCTVAYLLEKMPWNK